MLRADSCKDNPGWRVGRPQPAPEPALPLPGSLLPAGAAVSVFRCLPPPRLPGDFLFLGLLPVSENREAAGESWIRSRI